MIDDEKTFNKYAELGQFNIKLSTDDEETVAFKFKNVGKSN